MSVPAGTTWPLTTTSKLNLTPVPLPVTLAGRNWLRVSSTCCPLGRVAMSGPQTWEASRSPNMVGAPVPAAPEPASPAPPASAEDAVASGVVGLGVAMLGAGLGVGVVLG